MDTRFSADGDRRRPILVGVVCRLTDAIRDADKAENERDVRQEEKEPEAEVGRKKDTPLLEEVFWSQGKHTRAAALNATLQACFGAGFNLVDEEAWGS